MSYLKQYGSKRKFQEGGAMPADPAMAPAPAGPEAGGGGEEEQVMMLAQAAVQGDQAAAAELGMMLAPMILQEVQAAGAGGGEEGMAPAEPAAQPVFKRGGVFIGKN